MSFGYSAGDFYLCIQLLGSVSQSFGKGPLSATSQYSNFHKEFSLISQQLNELPEKSSSFVLLWGEVKAQCADFVLKYSSLVPTNIKAGVDKEANRGWLYEQGHKTFAKVKWPFVAREEAMALERNMLHLVQIAILDLNTRHYKAQQGNHERYELLLQQVRQLYAENSRQTNEQLENLQNGVNQIKDVLLPGENAKLCTRIEEILNRARDIMLPRRALAVSVQEDWQTAVSYDLEIKPPDPFRLLYINVSPAEFTFEQAYEELGSITTIMGNYIARQQSLPLLNASSIIDLLKHISQIVRVALSRIECQLPDDISQPFHYASDQRHLEATLQLVYSEWVRFVKLAKYECERSRPVQVSSNLGNSSRRLGDIVEENQWIIPRQGRQDTRTNAVHSGRSRRDSRDVSPRTKKPLSSRVGSFASPTVTNSAVGKPVKMDISHADESQDEAGELLKHCVVSEIKFEIETDTAIVKIQSKDGKAILRQQFGRNITPSVDRGNNGLTFNHLDSYRNFRTLDEDQTPHPSGAPIYVFKSKEDSHAFQSEVLQWVIPGWKIIYSAETKLIMHISTGDDCRLQILRVMQEYGTRCKSILYWETRCLELTGGKEDFVEWSQFEFDSVIKSGEKRAILHFADPNVRRKSSESKSSRFSFSSFRRSSRDMGQPPPQSPSLVPPQLQPVVFTPFPSGGSPDSEGSKSFPSSASPSSISTSAPSEFSIPLPPSAFEVKTELKAKAKREMEGLDIKFYSQKDRDDFIECFA